MCLYQIIFQILFVVIIILITINICNKYINFEHYDVKINRSSEQACGTTCTKSKECNAFTTNGTTCYLSKKQILAQPLKATFVKDFNKKNYLCNKIIDITNHSDLDETDLKQNATYSCANGLLDFNAQFKIYDNQEKDLSKLELLPVTNVDPYTFVDVPWGEEINLDKNMYLITNPVDNSDQIIEFVENDDEFLGQYMYKHKCVSDIAQDTCIKECANVEECIGTEWNPLYIKKNHDNTFTMYKNICCPKIKVLKQFPRRNDHKYGHFYSKHKLSKYNKKNSDIYINLGS